MPDRITEIASEVVAVLVPHVVNKHRELTYGELSKLIEDRFSDKVNAWHGFGGALGSVQEACRELNLPNLPVMVVDQTTRRPAEGWYNQFDLLFPELVGLDDLEKRKRAKDEVLWM